MKKLMLSLILVLFGLAATDAFARSGNYERHCGKKERCHKKVESCAPACKFDKVIESACPEIPCCERYVKVQEPAQIIKRIDYEAVCPAGCTPKMKAAGMLHAGQKELFEAGEE